jgi:hypothetical protein
MDFFGFIAKITTETALCHVFLIYEKNENQNKVASL